MTCNPELYGDIRAFALQLPTEVPSGIDHSDAGMQQSDAIAAIGVNSNGPALLQMHGKVLPYGIRFKRSGGDEQYLQ